MADMTGLAGLAGLTGLKGLTSLGGLDEIYVEGIPFVSNHGVLEEEKRLGQRFSLSLRLFLSVRKAGVTDDLSHSIHYGEITEQAIDFLQKHTYNLIEAAAEQLARELLRTREHLQAVEVSIQKPCAPVSFSFEKLGVRIFRQKHKAYLSLGSNLGDRKKHIQAGLQYLESHPDIRLTKVSKLLETKPYGYTDQPDFFNAAAEVETLLSPWELLDVLQAAEQQEGRIRDIHWGPRTLDMDLLFYDGNVISDERLTVPHPEIAMRQFVLQPLCEIAPMLRHPVLQKTVKELKTDLEQRC